VFADASEDGSDVFFTTAQPLVGQDTDEIADLYDAHVEGGLPAPVPPGACSSPEACRGASSPAPVPQAPTSATFTGPGNPTPPAPASGGAPPKPRTAAQIRAEKLTRALKACRKDRSRKKRVACEKSAHKSYGAATGAGARRASTNGRAGR